MRQSSAEERAPASGDLKSLQVLAVLLFLGGLMAILLGVRSLRGSENGTREYCCGSSKPEPPKLCPYCESRPASERYCAEDEEFIKACRYGRWKAFQRAG
jgi:hypothetical protein